MARRFILVETGNDEAAEIIREYVQALRVTDPSEPGADTQIVGEFIRPDDFCDHGNWTTEPGKPPVTQVRSGKTGWRVCTQCYKPIPDMSFLKNQLKPTDINDPEHEVVRGRDLGFFVFGLTAVSVSIESFKKE